MEERVKLLNRYLTGWGSCFGLAENPLDVRDARSLAPSPPPPSAFDGVEAPEGAAAQPDRAGEPSPRRPALGRKPKGTLAHVGLATTLPNPE
jgi:hypothetical protein